MATQALVTLKTGEGLELEVDTQYDEKSAAEKYCVGRKKEADEEFTRKINVLISQDDDPKHPGVVKVTTPTNDFIGYIVKQNVDVANMIINTLTRELPENNDDFHGKEILYQVTAVVDGIWVESEDSDGVIETLPDIDSFTIRIQIPPAMDFEFI